MGGRSFPDLVVEVLRNMHFKQVPQIPQIPYDEQIQNSHEGHYATEDAGTMDFLCLDEADNIVVIEIKRKGTDETLAQLCRCMGWVKENLAKENQKVLGTIVSESKDIKLEYAIKVVPNVTLKQMKLNVTVEDFE